MVFFLSLVTMAKGIGNGFPLAAVVTTPGKKQGWRGMGLVGLEGVGGGGGGEGVDYWLASHKHA